MIGMTPEELRLFVAKHSGSENPTQRLEWVMERAVSKQFSHEAFAWPDGSSEGVVCTCCPYWRLRRSIDRVKLLPLCIQWIKESFQVTDDDVELAMKNERRRTLAQEPQYLLRIVLHTTGINLLFVTPEEHPATKLEMEAAALLEQAVSLRTKERELRTRFGL